MTLTHTYPAPSHGPRQERGVCIGNPLVWDPNPTPPALCPTRRPHPLFALNPNPAPHRPRRRRVETAPPHLSLSLSSRYWSLAPRRRAATVISQGGRRGRVPCRPRPAPPEPAPPSRSPSAEALLPPRIEGGLLLSGGSSPVVETASSSSSVLLEVARIRTWIDFLPRGKSNETLALLF